MLTSEMRCFGNKPAVSAIIVLIFLPFAIGFSATSSPGEIFRKTPRILPGEILYSPKIAIEHLSIALSLDRAEKCLDLMDVRLAEFSAMVWLNRTAGIERLLSEYSFLSETYRTFPEKPDSFSRHARNLEILSDTLSEGKTALREEDRLVFSSVLRSISRKASLAGKIVERASFFSPLRLEAERNLAIAQEFLSEQEFLSSSSLPEKRASLRTAEILLREGEYLSSSIVSLELLESSRDPAFQRLGSLADNSTRQDVKNSRD